jgi:hypothetical protein
MNRLISTFILSLMIFHSSASAEDFVGKVLFVSGDAKVLRVDGSQQALQKQDGVLNNDHLITGDGVLQIKFKDGGFMSLQKHSEMKVENYHFEGSENGKESAIFSLLRGGLRALSGAIGHKRPGRYQLRTSVATIGIRGTAYSALLCQQDCSQMNGKNLADGLHAKTTEGTIFVENQGCILDIPAGKAAFVPDLITVPIYTEFNPSFATIAPRSQTVSRQAKRSNGTSPSASVAPGKQVAASPAESGKSSSRGMVSPTTPVSSGEISNFDRFVTRANSSVPTGVSAIAPASEASINELQVIKSELTALGNVESAKSRVGTISQPTQAIAPATTPQITQSLNQANFNGSLTQSIAITPTVSESVTEVLSNTNGINLQSGINQLNTNTPTINNPIINNNYSLPGNLINNPLHP